MKATQCSKYNFVSSVHPYGMEIYENLYLMKDFVDGFGVFSKVVGICMDILEKKIVRPLQICFKVFVPQLWPRSSFRTKSGAICILMNSNYFCTLYFSNIFTLK